MENEWKIKEENKLVSDAVYIFCTRYYYSYEFGPSQIRISCSVKFCQFNIFKLKTLCIHICLKSIIFPKSRRHDEYEYTRYSTFLNIFWIVEHFAMKIGQLKYLVLDNIARIHTKWFEGLGYKSRPSLIYQPVAINQKLNLMTFCFFTFLQMCPESTNNEHHLLKNNRTDYILFRQNHERAWN